ncbi:phytoene desaturase family protein [Pontibacter akesuensis]|uniref:Phytoene desaturase n=1 Tax=Pontibacter akesuensis TaxID=388950 RepID=A0A1I7GYF8_9BACT|nr:phytoene desaturase family protein [Pontibacter akesuensis]GHA54458.1 phytoene dehydrogenase [Pontibacter akesuensis]SFU53435.1 phytoene desaturase [Pontibacter akesuensis]
MIGTRVIVIGSGFSGLAAATSLADQGYEVTVLEKNDSPGGRARSFSADGFTFDMGPSWYWMPDVFESYFNKFGKSTSDYYDLKRLDPSYAVIFGENDFVNIPAQMPQMHALFESMEKGSAEQLDKFLEQAAYKYEVGINQLVYKPGRSLTEFMSPRLLLDVIRMDVFQSFHKHIRRFFRHDKIIKLMEFPILFLGALPQNTPALYSLMNYADISLGTWYPMGGMHKIVEGMVKLATEKGVKFRYNQDVQQLQVEKQVVHRVQTSTDAFQADVVVASADYHHVEKELLPETSRSYTDAYWEDRVMAPSSLLFYLGVSKRLQNLQHHNLFFDEDFGPHAEEIYTNPKWPTKPLFYVSAPSVTDPAVAPEGCENLFILIPVAPGLEDTEELREKYFNLVMDRLERLTKQEIRSAIVYKRSYAHRDFIKDYNAFKGNAYGLANTLLQTAILKPSLKSKKVKNLFYTGQLTVPGPGVPPSLISGQVVAKEVAKEFALPAVVTV